MNLEDRPALLLAELHSIDNIQVADPRLTAEMVQNMTPEAQRLLLLMYVDLLEAVKPIFDALEPYLSAPQACLSPEPPLRTQISHPAAPVLPRDHTLE